MLLFRLNLPQHYSSLRALLPTYMLCLGPQLSLIFSGWAALLTGSVM